MLNFRESITKEEINTLPVLEYPARKVVLVDTLNKLKNAIEVLKNEEVVESCIIDIVSNVLKSSSDIFNSLSHCSW